MKVYKGVSASPGLVLGQVSRLEHHVETFSHGPFNPERELRLLANAVHTAQNELDSMAERAAPTEQAIFLFQSMMLDDEGMMNEVRFCINAGISASAAMHQVGQRYADQLANMKDNPYMQLRSVDILDATRRVINILTNRPRAGGVQNIHARRGQRPESRRHHCPGNEHPGHRAGRQGFSGRLRRTHRHSGRNQRQLHP